LKGEDYETSIIALLDLRMAKHEFNFEFDNEFLKFDMKISNSTDVIVGCGTGDHLMDLAFMEIGYSNVNCDVTNEPLMASRRANLRMRGKIWRDRHLLCRRLLIHLAGNYQANAPVPV
jgi:hypothetical protein